MRTHLEQAYLSSLTHVRAYYDDIDEYGSLADSTHAFYFIPGVNGAAGQIRFVLPPTARVFGPRVYLKSLWTPDFSTHVPIWNKYQPRAIELRLRKLTSDLRALTERPRPLYVVASSNGMYDFLAVAGQLSEQSLRRIRLLWVSCAPAYFPRNAFVELLDRFTGITRGGHRWTAIPNANWMAMINSEARSTFAWRYEGRERTLYKADLESRFQYGGLDWAYTSLDCFNAMIDQALRRAPSALPVKTYALFGTRDGYWYGQPPGELDRLLRKYVPDHVLVTKPRTHLWVVAPDCVAEFLEEVARHEGHQLAPASRLAEPSAAEVTASL